MPPIHVGQHLPSPFGRNELFDRLAGECRLLSASAQPFNGIDDFRVTGGKLERTQGHTTPLGKGECLESPEESALHVKSGRMTVDNGLINLFEMNIVRAIIRII